MYSRDEKSVNITLSLDLPYAKAQSQAPTICTRYFQVLKGVYIEFSQNVL